MRVDMVTPPAIDGHPHFHTFVRHSRGRYWQVASTMPTEQECGSDADAGLGGVGSVGNMLQACYILQMEPTMTEMVTVSAFSPSNLLSELGKPHEPRDALACIVAAAGGP